MATILLVEDEVELARVITRELMSAGFGVEHVVDGETALRSLAGEHESPDIVVLDWMLPGIPPTGKRVEVPLVAIVRFRGDKLAHEHIYWDQASVLVQLGLLDPATLPVAGIETARKVLDNTLPSNALMQRAGPLE